MFQEKGKRWGAAKIVKRSLDSENFMDINRLSRMRLYDTTDRRLVDLYYAEAASIVYYMMVELGERRFEKLCRQLRDGVLFEEALTTSYPRFRSLQDLNRNWINYIKDQ